MSFNKTRLATCFVRENCDENLSYSFNLIYNKLKFNDIFIVVFVYARYVVCS